MANFNEITIVGRLTADPETRYGNNGKAVCNFTVAVDRPTKEKQTDFIRVVAWEKLAEICNEHLRKGKEVLIRGSLQLRKFEHNGQQREAAEVRADKMQMFGKRDDGDGGGYRSAPRESSAGYGDGGGGADLLGIDDVPFFACKV